MVTTISSSASRSSIVSSVVSVRISVRRASPYSSLMASSSSLMIAISLASDARIAFSSSISLRTSSCSSTIFCRSSAARRRSCMSRMALAWISVSVEPRHQGVAGRVGVGRLADDPDHEIELLDGLAQPGQDVGPLLRPRQVVARPPGDHLAAELDERLQHLLEVDDLRAAVDQRQHDDAEGRLHLGVLVELVEDDLRQLAPPQLEHHPDALAVRLVPDLRDALDPLLAAELRDLLDEARLVHLVRQLGDDDRLAPAPQLLGVGLGPQRDGASARRVRLADAARGRRCSRRSGSRGR